MKVVERPRFRVVSCFACCWVLIGSASQTPAAEPDQPSSQPVAKEAGSNASRAEREPEVRVTAEKGLVSVFAVSVDAHEVFTRIAEASGAPIIVDDTIQRKLTLNLTQKPVEDILAQISSAYGFSFSKVNGIYMVSVGIPKGPSSYLLSEIDAIRTQYVAAAKAQSLLPLFLQEHVKINHEQNSVILSAPREVLRKFREDVAQFDKPAAQIMIDILVVELTESGRNVFDNSVDWHNYASEALSKPATGEISIGALHNLPDTFATVLKALIEKGQARVRANPSVATLSGSPARVFVGLQQFVKTPVKLPEQEQGQESNFIPAGVTLEMTPFTGAEGEIITEVKPEVSTLGAPDPLTGLPEKTIRKAETFVRVRDGQTIIIGGLTQSETRTTRSKVPILGDLPAVGALFRSKSVENVRTELAIFITPTVLSLTGHLPQEREAELKRRFLNGVEKGKPQEGPPQQ